MSDTYSIGVMPARGAARGARSARRKRPIDFQRTLEMMSALGEFKPISTEEARQGLEMAQALDGYPIDDRPVGQRDPIQLGAPRERFDPMALDETAMAEIPGTPRLDVNDPQARRDAALAAMGPISVESGSWGEALAEGLTQYLRGQAGAREFDRAQDESSEEKFQERGRRNAMTAAAGMTDASPAMLASALSPYAPEEALQFSMEEGRGRRDRERKREDMIFALDAELDPSRAERRRGIAVADETALLTAREPFQVRADARATARAAAGRRGGGADLSAREEIRLEKAADAADSTDHLRNLAAEFQGLNRRVRTGPGSGAWGVGQVLNRERQRMNQITDEMTPLMRQPGSGSMSDSDRQMFRNAVPNTDVDGTVNDKGIAAITQAAQNSSDRASFLDQVSGTGSLQGAEQAWRSYLRANPIFDRHGNVRTDRPDFETWYASGRPDMSQEPAPSSAMRTRPLSQFGEPVEQTNPQRTRGGLSSRQYGGYGRE